MHRPLGRQAVFPCGVIVRGGVYGLRLTSELEDQQCARGGGDWRVSTTSNEATESDPTTSTEASNANTSSVSIL